MRLQVLATVLAALAAPALAAASPATSPVDADWTLPAVELGGGAVADVRVRVLVDEWALDDASCPDRAVLVVHGAAHNAASWEPFAEALLGGWWDAGACRVYAIDLPGHGGSGAPTGALYGELGIAHYAAAVRAVLDGLAADGVRVRTIVGHSMGGLVVQQLQAALVDEGTDLRRAYAIEDALLIASSLPAAVHAGCGEPATLELTPWPPPTPEPPTGEVVALPDVAWRALFFTDRTGATIRGAPDLSTVARYNAVESGAAIEQILGIGAPALPAGLFDGARLRLTVLAHAGDPFARTESQRCLHRYLSSQPGGAGFVVMEGPGAIHDAHVSSPDDVVRAVAGRAALP
jgi:pimeloyl-ACP methyl ester carboxylesterase